MDQKPSRPVSVCWFRRDLRLSDHAALYHALKSGNPVLCVFIFDKDILDRLEQKTDRRVQFIHDTLRGLKSRLRTHGSDLYVPYGRPEEAWEEILRRYEVRDVYTNRDYEPDAIRRDKKIGAMLSERGVGFHTFKDQVVFEPNEVYKADGKPYTVYTPFANKWMEHLRPFYLQPYPTEKYAGRYMETGPLPMPALEEIGFGPVDFTAPDTEVPDSVLAHYADTRNFPSLENGTSRLGLHLRFGTVGIRTLAARAASVNTTYLKELVWREFFMHILYHFPEVQTQCFRKEYERIRWRNDEGEFRRWCEGRTGYPIVDAGMRELNETGFMHNRVRMVAASFLTKHLLVDWRWGERYFAEKLLDYDLAANVGNWQWAAGCGCDAAPYFRVFNPYTQAEKFDPDGRYIRKWVPELQTFDYPAPVVEHKFARERVLKAYGEAVKKQ